MSRASRCCAAQSQTGSSIKTKTYFVVNACLHCVVIEGSSIGEFSLWRVRHPKRHLSL